MLNIAMSDIIQKYLIEIWVLKDCNLRILLWAKKKQKCSIHNFPLTFSLKNVCHDSVWYDENFGGRKNTSKMKNFVDLGSYFYLNQ